MTPRIKTPRLNRLMSALLLASLAAPLAAPLHADSWPQEEAGAEAAGFTAEGIEQLDAAMREIVANQDVAGMVWMLGKDGQIATFEAAGLARVNDQ
ncbi:MAG: hypothetical protein KKD00_08155, partial [Gammaproteobacteria bacterium]|nr:hypothetical protein [Gammaproteobacteria bacterium]